MQGAAIAWRLRFVRVSLLYLALSQKGSAVSEPVQVVDNQNRAMTARLITSDGKSVTFARESDKKSFNVPLETLDAATQKTVRDWIAGGGSLGEKYQITVDTGRNRGNKAGDDFDDKRINLNPTVVVKNPDPTFQSRDAKVTVLFFGRPVEDISTLNVLRTQTFDLIKLDPLKENSFSVAKISQAYDSRGFAKFGSRYAGYAVFVHDAAKAKVYQSDSVPASLVSIYGSKLLALETGGTFDKNLK